MYRKKIQNGNLTEYAQILRKNMTKEERLLWSFLRRLPFTVNRQKVIGEYIVDFCCSKEKLIIELDGSQHYEDDARRRDQARDEYLTGLGYKVLRYSNYALLKNFQAVKEEIEGYLK